MEERKNEKLALYWLCNQTGRRHQAGVAFFNEEQSDYRLKVDVFPEEKMFYLKAVGASDGKIHYRVETVVRKNGQPTHRAQIGTGYSSSENGFPVYMDIGPFCRSLVME